MINNFIAKKTVIASLILVVLLLPAKSNGVDDKLVCPLTSEVPVGQLVDQTAFTADKILKEAIEMIDTSIIEVAAANEMVSLVDSCSVDNCNSACHGEITYTACDTSCSSDYTCDFTNKFVKGINLGSSVYNCSNMNHFNPTNNLHYSRFSLSFNSPPCDIAPCSGYCYRPACEKLDCDPKTCQGEACPFAEIQQTFETIVTSDDQIITSNQIISDVFNKNVTVLQPLLGEICKIPILKIVCGWIGKPEINIILDLFIKSYENINNCKTSSFELEKMLISGDTGRILLPCQALTPDPLKECYPNNYYCCH